MSVSFVNFFCRISAFSLFVDCQLCSRMEDVILDNFVDHPLTEIWHVILSERDLSQQMDETMAVHIDENLVSSKVSSN